MKLYRYWTVDEAELQLPDGSLQKSRIFGHSNESPEDAAANAAQNRRLIQARLAGDPSAGDEWYDTREVVREEIVRSLNEKNIITRNRYGALILNSETLVIVDIDYSKGGFGLSWWQRLLGRKPENPEASALEFVRKRAAMSDYEELNFRVYQTRAGLRLIVRGDEKLAMDFKRSLRLMRDFHADDLYAFLCGVQRSYRARLTPKPYRIKQPPIRLEWPRDAAEERVAAEWVTDYEERGNNYAVCHFVEAIGAAVTAENDPVIAFHDEITGAETDLPLA